MKTKQLFCSLLAILLFSVSLATAETWYVYTSNGKTLNLRSEYNNAVIGHIPYGTALEPDMSRSTETFAYVTYKNTSGFVKWSFLQRNQPAARATSTATAAPAATTNGTSGGLLPGTAISPVDYSSMGYPTGGTGMNTGLGTSLTGGTMDYSYSQNPGLGMPLTSGINSTGYSQVPTSGSALTQTLPTASAAQQGTLVPPAASGFDAAIFSGFQADNHDALTYGQTVIRWAPSEQAPAVRTCGSGVEVEVLMKDNTWSQVYDKELKYTGFVLNSSLISADQKDLLSNNNAGLLSSGGMSMATSAPAGATSTTATSSTGSASGMSMGNSTGFSFGTTGTSNSVSSLQTGTSSSSGFGTGLNTSGLGTSGTGLNTSSLGTSGTGLSTSGLGTSGTGLSTSGMTPGGISSGLSTGTTPMTSGTGLTNNSLSTGMTGVQSGGISTGLQSTGTVYNSTYPGSGFTTYDSSADTDDNG